MSVEVAKAVKVQAYVPRPQSAPPRFLLVEVQMYRGSGDSVVHVKLLENVRQRRAVILGSAPSYVIDQKVSGLRDELLSVNLSNDTIGIEPANSIRALGAQAVEVGHG